MVFLWVGDSYEKVNILGFRYLFLFFFGCGKVLVIYFVYKWFFCFGVEFLGGGY